MSSKDDLKVLHRIIRYIAHLATSSFFTEVRVIGADNVPENGPIIVVATHHNMMLDPVILSSSFPYQRILNYWSKATLFGNPVMAWILYSTGNIPVDRKSKDRRVLFKGTFEALSAGYAVALFPEGTSYTEHRIMQIKDGAAWSALEYTKWCEEQGIEKFKDVHIIPAGIVYTNKSKYRSNVIVDYGKPISMGAYMEQYLSQEEGAQRSAVKLLSKNIEDDLVRATINAPDWDTLYVARMARDLLWEREQSLDLDHFVPVSQTLVDLFSTPNVTPNIASVRLLLLEYYSLLQSTHLTNAALAQLPLPRNLDPNRPAPLPSRLYTLSILIRDTLGALLKLPFFTFPLIVHSPVYFMGRLGARLVMEEEESQAQNKVVFGLLSLILIYPMVFFFLWAFFWFTPMGAAVAAGTLYLFGSYHNRMINANYESAKQIIAAWRVLVGIWAPKRLEFGLPDLTQYTTPWIPKENPWVTRPAPKSTPVTPAAALQSNPLELLEHAEPPVSISKNSNRSGKRPSSRRIMRHVLRARVEAVKGLATFFFQLEGGGAGKKVFASNHLAEAYGAVDHVKVESGETEPIGWRTAGEVRSYLQARGAKIPTLASAKTVKDEEEWAGLSSDNEGDGN